MDKIVEERLGYISNNFLPTLKKKWNVKELKFEPLSNKKGQEQFQSVAIFGDIVIDDEKTEGDKINNRDAEEQIEELASHLEKTKIRDSKRIGVVIKMQICDFISLNWTNGGVNFFNEIFFYNELLPYFNSKVSIVDIFPEMIHGHFSDQKREEDIIVLKNLNKENYRLTPSKTVQSLEHILLAIKKLGRFHACSHIMKSLDKTQFMEKVSSFKFVKTWIYDPSNQVFGHFKKCSKRPASYVEKFPEYKKKLAKSGYTEYFENLQPLMAKIYEPNEKMAVVCHGDFNRNNMLFKYDTKCIDSNSESILSNGRHHNGDATNDIPTDVKFFDFADVVYGSPVLDLAFFLFMNTSKQMRETHWDTILQTYHQSLRTECEKFPGVVFPSLEDISKDFRTNCMPGFMICSFFLPMMMETKLKDRSEWTDTPSEEEEKEMYNTGGEEATRAVGEILMFVLDKGFI